MTNVQKITATTIPDHSNIAPPLPPKRKLTKYEEVVCMSIIAHDVYFQYDGEHYNIRNIVRNIMEQQGFDGDAVFAKFITSAVYEKQGNREDVSFLPTDVEKEVDISVEKKFFTIATNVHLNNPESAEEITEIAETEIAEVEEAVEEVETSIEE